MQFEELDRLLNPAPMPLELGYERLENGVMHVAIRTDMHGCSGAMFDWWFASRPLTQWYRWWHPVDHVASSWLEESPHGGVIGAIHQVEERFTAMPAERLSIQFRDPEEMFGAASLTAARATGAVSAVICGHGGGGFEPRRRPDGAIIGSRMVHIARDTPWGMVLRSHFFLGHDLPGVGVPRPALVELFPDGIGPGLLQHCYDEFTFLSRLLPSLYIAENRDNIPVQLPW